MDEKEKTIKDIITKNGSIYSPIHKGSSINNIYELLVNNTIFEPDCNQEYEYLGFYYLIIQKDYKLMKKYYMKSIENNGGIGMCNLGYYYYNIKKNYDKAKKYFLMAVSINHRGGMRNLGTYYSRIENNNKLAKKYYIMASEHGDSVSMSGLSLYYFEKDKYKKMHMYFNMSIANVDNNVIMPQFIKNYYNNFLVDKLEFYINFSSVIPRYKIIKLFNKLAIEEISLTEYAKFECLMNNFEFHDDDNLSNTMEMLT